MKSAKPTQIKITLITIKEIKITKISEREFFLLIFLRKPFIMGKICYNKVLNLLQRNEFYESEINSDSAAD